jgi:hypothetical protein
MLILTACLILACISYPSDCQQPSDKIDLYYTNLPLLEHLIKSGVDSVRRQRNLPYLFSDSICYLAASDHGQYLMDLEEIRHFQSDSMKKTPQDRAEYYGAEGYRVGENIVKIYLNIPFSYQVGVSQPKTMSVATYKDAAAFVVNAWVNSAEHYLNILSRDYDVTGVAAIVNEDDHSLICVQVFAEVSSDYQIKAYPSVFPYEKHVAECKILPSSPLPKQFDCGDKQTWNIKYPDDDAEIILFENLIGSSPDWHVIYNGRDIYLDMGAYESAVRLFNHKTDGLTLEIIPWYIYDCNDSSGFFSSVPEMKECISNGVLTKPVYLDRLFRKEFKPRKNNSEVYHHFIPYAGRIPDKIAGPYEVNVIFLKNNKIFKLIQSHHLCGEVPDHLIEIPLYTYDTIPRIIYQCSSECMIDTFDISTRSYDASLFSGRQLVSETDSCAVVEYLKVFSLLSSVVQQTDENLGLMNLIYSRMDSIQNYLFTRFLEGKLDFSVIEALPALITDDEGYFQRFQPLAELYYHRMIFRYHYLGNEFTGTELQEINEMMRSLRNPPPVAQYNYYAMLFREMNGEITGNITLANLREISNIIQRIEGSIPQDYLDSLQVFYHFQRVLKYYTDGMFDYRRMYPSLKYIRDYYKSHYLSPEGRVKLSRFFIHFRLYDFAYETILPAAGLHPYDKEAFILHLKLYYSGLIQLENKSGYYTDILDASDILSTEEWLGLFEGSCRINFQLLDYEPLRDLYCAKKRSLQIKNQDKATSWVSF